MGQNGSRLHQMMLAVEEKMKKEAARFRDMPAPPGMVEELQSKNESKLQRMRELVRRYEAMMRVSDARLRIKNSNKRVSFEQFRKDLPSVISAARRRALPESDYAADLFIMSNAPCPGLPIRKVQVGEEPSFRAFDLYAWVRSPIGRTFCALASRDFPQGCGFGVRAPSLEQLDRKLYHRGILLRHNELFHCLFD